MDNIYEILDKIGISVPTDKKDEFDKLLLENYRTVNEVKNLQAKLEKAEGERDTYKDKYDTDIKQRDADIKDLQTKLKNAGTDAEKLKNLETDLATLQTNYDTAKTDYEKKLAEQAYEFAVKQKASELNFSSNSAKKAFIADAIKEQMKLKDGELQGFDGFLESYKKTDADAFIKEDTSNGKTEPSPTIQFSGKSGGTDQNKSDEGNKTSATFW